MIVMTKMRYDVILSNLSAIKGEKNLFNHQNDDGDEEEEKEENE